MATSEELYDEAVNLRDQGDKETAIAKLNEVIALDPNHVLAHGLLAKLHADLAQADQAIAHALKVVELEPKDTFSYTALSVIYQRCGRIREAEEAKAKAFYMQQGWEP
jgi:Flp pilus assembly protein TadD